MRCSPLVRMTQVRVRDVRRYRGSGRTGSRRSVPDRCASRRRLFGQPAGRVDRFRPGRRNSGRWSASAGCWPRSPAPPSRSAGRCRGPARRGRRSPAAGSNAPAESRTSLLQVVAEQTHQVADLPLRAPPVLGREAEQGQVADAQPNRAFRRRLHRLGAAPVPGRPRQSARRRPASVAVHDDGDVQRRRARLASRADRGSIGSDLQDLALLLGKEVVERYGCADRSDPGSACPSRGTWSCEMPPSFSAFLSSSMACRRTLRTATRASSA